MKIKFYGLLYVSKKDSTPNLNYRNIKNKIFIYSKNAENLFFSLKKINYEFIIVTNKPYLIKKFVSDKIKIKKIKFIRKVPKNINFFSSHFKLDLYKYLSNRSGYNGMLDLDMILINKFSDKFLKLIGKTNMVMNLNDNKNKQYNKIIKKSLKLCNNLPLNDTSWYGGEFIIGNKKFYEKIYNYSKLYLNNYLSNLDKVHHHGDEMLLNAALQTMKYKKKKTFVDISNQKVIARYWTINTLHKQKKIKYYLNHSLLHLPSDKEFLSKLNIKDKSLKEIKTILEKHFKSKNLKILNFLKKVFQFIKNLIK